jgi:hypothetical protein
MMMKDKKLREAVQYLAPLLGYEVELDFGWGVSQTIHSRIKAAGDEAAEQMREEIRASKIAQASFAAESASAASTTTQNLLEALAEALGYKFEYQPERTVAVKIKKG